MSAFYSDESQVNPFWPAVSDLMLAVVLILCMIVAAVSVSSFPIQEIERAQEELARTQRFKDAGYFPGPERKEKTEYWSSHVVTWVRSSGAKAPIVSFEVRSTDPYLQRITFADTVLFPSDRSELSKEGERVLATLAAVIAPETRRLEQIQIHGHADTRGTQSARDNLELASLRANAVFRYLTGELSNGATLDPVAGPLMSATSFGHNAPVGRSKKPTYSLADLCADNGVGVDERRHTCGLVKDSTEQMSLNRRVEVWLYYKAAAAE